MQHRTTTREVSNKLYLDVLNDIEGLLARLGRETDDERVSKALRYVEQSIRPIHDELVTRIESLRDHARWDRFTIAFYGETNAGKSTTIETLRILLGERTKRDAHAKFHALQKEHGLSEPAWSALMESILHHETHLAKLCSQEVEDAARRDVERKALEDEMQSLRGQIDSKTRSASLRRKLVHLWRKMPEELALTGLTHQHCALAATHAAEHAARQADIEAVQDVLKEGRDRQAEVLLRIADLEPFADGHIVGTGRSDFTRDTQAYTFEANGQHFELLDLPGIEGKEADVIDSILGAVRSAHAVFYITGKAAPPQTRDEDGEGTLEKVRAHLGDHTEIWSIYNKRITNPISLEKAELLNDSERDGLVALDATMREHLGSRYRGCIALSSQPAFLAASECLVPGSDLLRNRAKFLARFSVEEALAKSGFRQFVDRLTNSMIADCETRMRAANVNKVHFAVKGAEAALMSARKETIGPLAEACRKDWTHVEQQLDLAVSGLSQTVLNLATDAISSFENRVRASVYEKIEAGIDNDDLKSLLKKTVLTEQTKLGSGLRQKIGNKLDRFRDDVAGLLDRFRERVAQLQDVYSSHGDRGVGRDFEFDMQFDSGVQYAPLIAAVVGGVLMLWNPVGWLSLAVGGLTLIVGIAKALWGLVDSDFKKGQQRKATNENLERIVQSMHDAMKTNCDELRTNVDERMSVIRADIKRSVDQAADVNSAMIKVCANLNRFSKTIAQPGGAIQSHKKKRQ
ncbi:hypothetical protein ASG35_04635 [Burkholderia sp. Leaf177]|uniref:hypothetical protein n=1 Tax=Burkholderia sp. Leaf177 TaxID=1736287 RepID=UPI0006F504B3|nr:hypothetical protein [Burkholderia sp. Leaf177]KQR81599.1 hypothetical protein ASG35_04635 [Burkholderia sp. Leaf177]